MSILKIMMLGKTGSGKTQVATRLIEQKVPRQLRPTVGIQTLRHAFKGQGVTLEVKDTNGKGELPSIRRALYKEQAFLLYCVDLRTGFDEEGEMEVKNELDLYRAANPNGKVILVGTHGDQCKNSQEALIELENSLIELGLTIDNKVLISSAEDNIKELQDYLLRSLVKKADVARPSETDEKDVKSSGESGVSFDKKIADSITEETTSEQKSEDSIFVNAKKTLLMALEHLPEEKKKFIEKKLSRLEEKLNKKNLSRKSIETLINSFVQGCHDTLEGQHPNVIKAVFGVAAAVIVTLLASVVGFLIGVAAGAWAGPGAFITGLIGGQMAAVATASTCASAGILAGGITTWGMFKPSKEMTAVDEFAKAIQEHYVPKK
ncbi:ADP-ribosylation factor-like protein [Legionella jamestowniensis]|uniref:Rho GTPase (Miro-like) n=1 Tax=Legionella jamestowniensis TaxID=455 RepID=A0A0W0UFV5_9GAMM|nr:ADP-ribosylation factor-like protein [Legionella jamestowniensis]KTD06712.1 Rho GTPase (Miro-like) [Legionella jamestowniensis]SFL84365.1 Ras of Complex, Roc, domain of DAPkinase [Legionella jamestowniensis DSM 19215]